MSVENAITVAFNNVKSALATVRKDAGPTTSSVILLGYPQLFPVHPPAVTSCGPLMVTINLADLGLGPYVIRIPILTATDQVFFNQMADLLDGYLQAAAKDAGVNYVGVRPAFSHHGICGSEGAYINGLTFRNGFLNPSGSFHPNGAGQAAYAGALENYINNVTATGVALNPGGFPFNPTPYTPAGSVSEAAMLSRLGLPLPSGAAKASLAKPSTLYGNLYIGTSVASLRSGNQGALHPGAALKVTGGGFAPDARVDISITSLATGSVLPAKTTIETVQASRSGSIDATVHVPVAASGITMGSSRAGGIAFLDAVGPGSTSGQADDVAMLALAPRTSSCSATCSNALSVFHTSGPSALAGQDGPNLWIDDAPIFVRHVTR
jgi:hypothetical protein